MKAVCDDISVEAGETALLREATERIRDMDRALRAHMSNMTVKGLPSFIALSRHQFELASFVSERTGNKAEKPVTLLLKDHATGESHPYTMVEREPEREVSEEEREMFRDISWRAHALGGVLDDFQKKLTVNSFGELIELSNHQCELVDYLSTGKFRKSPRRRKARTLGAEGVAPESQERIEALGEALKEYQGRIEIKGLREFIALSKHQCELAGMVADYRWGGRQKSERLEDRMVFNLVHYGEAFPDAVGSVRLQGDDSEERGNGGNPPLSPLKLRGDEEGLWAVDVHADSCAQHPEHAVENTMKVRGAHPESFGHAKVSENSSHPSTAPLSLPDRAVPKTKKPQPVIKSAPVKAKTWPVLIEGEVRKEDGALEPHAHVQLGMKADRAGKLFSAAADREGKFSQIAEIETPPGDAHRVVVWGKAMDRVYAMPLQFAQVRVKVRSDGFERSFECEASGNGEFSRTFEREKDDGFP